MKPTLTAAEAHRQYDEAVSAFRRQIMDPTVRLQFGHEVDDFMRRCALGVWQADNAAEISPRHIEFYNAIYCRGNPVPSALFWEVATQVADYPGFEAPGFFSKMLENDRLLDQHLARRFADLTTLMMLLFAAVDNVVSDAEAGFVNRCSDLLLEQCRLEGRLGDKPVLKAEEFVTNRPAPAAPAQADRSKPEDEPEVQSPPKLEDVLAELDALCGLEQVKKDVRSLINLVKVRKLRQQAGLPVPAMSLHLVFMGNPGTGKTTVARLLARIYHAIGVLSKGQLVEVDRSGLVAGFVGQTAIKTSEVIQKALGGVLFIDEAYALVNQDSPNDFGHEAIEVLLKNMEDHRDDLIVIVAGYSNLMEKFIHSNPGLESRFNKYFYFDDYTGEQLMEIFQSMCQKNGYTLSPEAEQWCREDLQQLYETRDENFGNARDVRNLFEKAVARQSDRVALLEAPGREQLMELQPDDLKQPEEE